jgi:prepilin-type N-terminal cleavage/methylation domain-containing protein
MRNSRGFSLVELLVVIAIIAVILSVAVPLINKARLNGVETMVAKEMQTIATAQTQYQSQFGKYAASLAELGPPVRGGAEGPQAAHLIQASLASGEKDGYLFVVALTSSGYTVNATPKVFGTTGRRTFYLDQDGIVHQNWGEDAATADSPEFK